MNQLTLLDRIANKALKKALKEYSTLEDNYSALGLKLDDIYEKHVNSEFKQLERALLLKPRLDELLEKHGICQKSPEKITENMFWITLRPPKEHEHRFAEFRHIVMNDYITRKCFIDYKLCFEQKGTENNIGFGYHVHILAHMSGYLMRPQIVKDTKSTFKKFLNGDVFDAFVEVEYVRTKDFFNNIRAYMMGYKVDGWKEPACDTDIIWRKQLNLDPLYGNLDLERFQ